MCIRKLSNTSENDQIRKRICTMMCPKFVSISGEKKTLEEEFEKKSSPPDERYGHKEDQQLSDLESPPQHK